MILHIDMDAFYASVEERENPKLVGSPVVVGGQPSARGVVAAANYAARQFGIHSAMPMVTAVEKCAELLIIPPNAALYSRVSGEIRDIFHRYTPIVEPLSLDEAFLDPRGSERLHGGAEEIGRKIKSEIKGELGLVASVGVAPNKFLAKLASDHDKPDGFTVIQEDQVQNFLDPLPVEKIWGVGKSAKSKLSANGIYKVKDIRECKKAFLDDLFGVYGSQLWKLARGIDNRIVVTDSDVKSVSQETTFEQDISDHHILESVALNLTEGVGYRLRKAELMGRTITLKIRFNDFRTITRSRSLENGTQSTRVLWSTAKQILSRELGSKKFAIRLIGVGVSNFDALQNSQKSLFDTDIGGSEEPNSSDPIDQLSDKIQEKYGKGSIKRGKSVRQ